MREWRTRDELLTAAVRKSSARRGACLSAAYVEPPAEMRWRCAEGHEWNADARSIARGGWCEVCRRERLERTAPLRARTRAGIPLRIVPERDLAAILEVPRPELRQRARGIRRRGTGDDRGYSLGDVWHLLTEAQKAKARAYAAVSPHRPRGARVWISGYPALVAEWHPTKNPGLSPDTLRWGSSRDVWWRCRRGHAWQAKPNRRTRYGEGCPYCSGKRVSATNSLAARYPTIAKQWHPTKNGSLSPRDVTAGSSKRVWWRCTKGREHEWQAQVSDRQRAGCPFCAGNRPTSTTSLAARNPSLAAEWHEAKNRPLTPAQVTLFSERKVWWRCARGHVFHMRIAGRARGDGCPSCSGKRVTSTNSLAARAPKTAKLWHPTRNGSLTPRDVTKFSMRVVWWRCPEGSDHVWQGQVAAQSIHLRCAFCCNRRVSVTNRLSTVAPAVARQWHPTRNGKLTPRDVVATSKLRAWWRCARGHVWQARIQRRTVRGDGCPDCR